jgi:hypothetical protein
LSKSSNRAKFKIMMKNNGLFFCTKHPCTAVVQDFLPVRQFGERAVNRSRSCGFGAGVLVMAQVSSRYE